MISVAIVEDDEVIREGVREYLDSQENMICTLAKSSVESFLAVLHKENLPDVILMDIGLPGMSGISGMKLINEKYPAVNIIMFTVYIDSHRIFESLCAGASGYLLKNTAFPDMKQAIEIIHAGGSMMSPPIARKVMEHFHSGRKKQVSSPLTGKEKEIVQGLVDGLSYKMIAGSASISIETVRSHIKNIYKKLHVHCKADVIRKSLSGEI
ncbi:MAG: response regulator transcription factor [Bacteroidales bacterium]|nr:response regulator transcription factor [Bacteroidales bacterium]